MFHMPHNSSHARNFFSHAKNVLSSLPWGNSRQKSAGARASGPGCGSVEGRFKEADLCATSMVSRLLKCLLDSNLGLVTRRISFPLSPSLPMASPTRHPSQLTPFGCPTRHICILHTHALRAFTPCCNGLRGPPSPYYGITKPQDQRQNLKHAALLCHSTCVQPPTIAYETAYPPHSRPLSLRNRYGSGPSSQHGTCSPIMHHRVDIDNEGVSI